MQYVYRKAGSQRIQPYLNCIDELAPMLSKLGKESSETIIVGDFNLDLLKVNDRQKIGDYFYLFCTNGFYPMITLPTRFSSNKCTLINQIYCKLSTATRYCTAGILMSNISDHLPYFINFDKLQSKQSTPKHIKLRIYNEKSTLNYCESVRQLGIMEKLNQDSHSDPNTNYEIIEGILTQLYVNHIPVKTVRCNKYKH